MIKIRQMNIDNNGELQEFMPATPIGMACEHKGCTNTIGKDYKRIPSEIEDGWDNEPIFLCEEHSEGRELF